MDTITHAARTAVDITFTLDAAPERVFPLLCPVLEYQWIPDWECTMVHSDSGVAELGCVFLRGEGETWITTRYEPPSRIDYAIFLPGQAVGMLEFTLTPLASGTRVDLMSTTTPIQPRGHVHGTQDERRALWALRRTQMDHFLRTGTMLPA
ncbi:MAG TPA: SRPBCC family protein [Cellulomonas sp.]